MTYYIVYDKVTHQKIREGSCPRGGFAAQAIHEGEAVIEPDDCIQVTLIEPKVVTEQ